MELLSETEDQNELAVTSKICEFSVNKTIFKMAAVRHIEFSKFDILVTRPVLERDSALSYKISL